MWKLRWVVVLSCGLCCISAIASPEADRRYGFKSLLVAVMNADNQNLHALRVQAEMDRFFQARPRFEPSTEAFVALRVAEGGKPPPGDLSQIGAQALEQSLTSVPQTVDSVLLAQLQRVPGGYRVALVAAALRPVEILFQKTFPVANRYWLESVAQATLEGLNAFMLSLPFDATIVGREGQRVVIDRGGPSFRQGARVPVFTIEKQGGLELKETGTLLINRVEKDLTFATVVVENKPLEVLKGNKLRFQNPVLLATTPPARTIASASEASTADLAQKEKSGAVGIALIGNSIGWNRTDTSGNFVSSTAFYPGASLRAELGLTHDAFIELGGFFGSAKLTTTGSTVGLSSEANQVRAQVGYRLPLTDAQGPGVRLRAGYSRTQFQTDEIPTAVGPSSVLFSGLSVGGGFDFPLLFSLGLGLELNVLLFPSLTEGSGGTSGASVNGLAAWDFTLRAYYAFNEKLSLETRLLFQTFSAQFTGQGTRPVAFASMSQSARALTAGISYSF